MLRASGADYYNPDEAAREIRKASPGLGQRDANGLAWGKGRDLLQRAIDERKDFVFESTLGAQTIPALLAEAARKGAAVHVWFVGLDGVERHLARVRARVKAGGHDIPEADIRYQILRPGEAPDEAKAKRAERDPNGGARVSFEAKVPDEYTVVAWGAGTDPTGEKVTGDAKARYVVYPEVSDEMLRPAANPEFLLALENTANGTAQDAARRADQLPKFLEQMRSNPPKLSTPRPKPYPDWRRDKQQWFLPAMLVLFVAVLGLEWGLRRAWGMV